MQNIEDSLEVCAFTIGKNPLNIQKYFKATHNYYYVQPIKHTVWELFK